MVVKNYKLSVEVYDIYIYVQHPYVVRGFLLKSFICVYLRGTATGISEGDAALGQVRRLCDILGGAFLDAEVVGVWGLRIFVKIYDKAPKRHPTRPERRPIEPKKRPKGPRRPPRENTGDPRGTEEEPKEGESRIPRN